MEISQGSVKGPAVNCLMSLSDAEITSREGNQGHTRCRSLEVQNCWSIGKMSHLQKVTRPCVRVCTEIDEQLSSTQGYLVKWTTEDLHCNFTIISCYKATFDREIGEWSNILLSGKRGPQKRTKRKTCREQSVPYERRKGFPF